MILVRAQIRIQFLPRADLPVKALLLGMQLKVGKFLKLLGWSLQKVG